MTTFTFNSKETYLAYRSEWKAQYKELSQQIRNAKFCRWYCSLRNPKRITPAMTARFQKIGPTTDWTYWNIFKMRERATFMLEQLKLAKQEAQRQYLAAKAQKGELTLA